VKIFSSAELQTWAQKYLKPSATVVFDGRACFRAVEIAGCTHHPEIVGKQRTSTDMGCFHWVNTLLSNLKTSIDGNYHGLKFDKYVHRYLSEVQYRFNRRFDLASILPRLIFAGSRTGPRSEVWLRLVED
jgi:ISXO2-like transposase domain